MVPFAWARLPRAMVPPNVAGPVGAPGVATMHLLSTLPVMLTTPVTDWAAAGAAKARAEAAASAVRRVLFIFILPFGRNFAGSPNVSGAPTAAPARKLRR